MVRLTFANIAHADQSPQYVRTVVTVGGLVEGFLDEEVSMAVVGGYRRAARTVDLLSLLGHP